MIEPSPSKTGDKFAWSERASSNSLNYWLPLHEHNQKTVQKLLKRLHHTGEKFAWSERAGSNPLNYWLPLYEQHDNLKKNVLVVSLHWPNNPPKAMQGEMQAKKMKMVAIKHLKFKASRMSLM